MKTVNIDQIKLSADQHNLLHALMRRQTATGCAWYDVATSQYVQGRGFIDHASSGALRGLETRGLIKLNSYWRGASLTVADGVHLTDNETEAQS